MIKMRYSLVGCAVLGLIVAMPASAASMRCGSHIIQDGVRDGPGKYEVLKKCGEPTERAVTPGSMTNGGNPNECCTSVRMAGSCASSSATTVC